MKNVIEKTSALQSLLIGRGRLSSHFANALKKLNVPFEHWTRNENEKALYEKISRATHIFILIPDRSLSSFVDHYEAALKDKTLIHFSATHRDPRILGFHPLGTFTLAANDDLINLDFSDIHFHGTQSEETFKNALPFLKNSYTQLSEENMQLYHALCVYAANFSALLWKSFFSEMQQIGVQNTACENYFKMFSHNVLSNPQTAVTGPLVRNDFKTIEKNLLSLTHKADLKAIYEKFVEVYASQEASLNHLKSLEVPVS